MLFCQPCGGAIKKGQIAVALHAFVRGSDAYGYEQDYPMDMEDGARATYAHYGCLMKLCPGLVGIHLGEPLRE